MNVEEFMSTARALERMPRAAFDTVAGAYGFGSEWINDSGWPWFHRAPMGFVAHFLSAKSTPNGKPARDMCQELVDSAMLWASS